MTGPGTNRFTRAILTALYAYSQALLDRSRGKQFCLVAKRMKAVTGIQIAGSSTLKRLQRRQWRVELNPSRSVSMRGMDSIFQVI